MAYSKDYRQMILNKLYEGYSMREIAKAYGHSTSTLQSWKKDINKKPNTGRPKKIDDELLRQDIAMYPDAYQHERAYRFNCTDRGISNALKRLGITQKRLGITQKKESQPSQS